MRIFGVGTIFFLMIFVAKEHVGVSKFSRCIETGFSYFVYPCALCTRFCEYKYQAIVAFFQTKRDLQEQIALLQEKHVGALQELIMYKSSQLFSEQIVELVEFKKRYCYQDAQLVQIIQKKMGPDEYSFLIDAGSVQGVTLDRTVVVNNCLVGKVIEVYPWYSKVLLVIDPHCKVATLCINTRTQGIYQGLGNNKQGLLTFIDHLAPLQLDDWVISSGEGIIFPRGFLLGKISAFEQAGMHYDATIDMMLDFSQLTYCYLMQSRLLSASDAPIEVPVGQEISGQDHVEDLSLAARVSGHA